jgi:serine/threonine-protein kinase OSR1/STK39
MKDKDKDKEKESEKKKYPIGAEHYILYEEIGQGVSASVFRAQCIPFNDIVAIKILDFERDNCDLVRSITISFIFLLILISGDYY